MWTIVTALRNLRKPTHARTDPSSRVFFAAWLGLTILLLALFLQLMRESGSPGADSWFFLMIAGVPAACCDECGPCPEGTSPQGSTFHYTTHVYMANTVQLSSASYNLLRSLKQPGESFSDVVMRLATARKNPRALKRLSGVRADYDVDVLRAASAVEEVRRLTDRVKKGS